MFNKTFTFTLGSLQGYIRKCSKNNSTTTRQSPRNKQPSTINFRLGNFQGYIRKCPTQQHNQKTSYSNSTRTALSQFSASLPLYITSPFYYLNSQNINQINKNTHNRNQLPLSKEKQTKEKNKNKKLQREKRAMEQTISKRIWHIIQAVYYMLRKGISKKKLMMDLHLLLQRGKLAGKSLSHLLTLHPHTSGSSTSAASAFSCLSVDPNLYNPTEVEFSCSNTPHTPAAFHLPKWGKKSHKAHHELSELDAVAIAKAFEILNTASEARGDANMSALATPSPMLALALGKSPAVARQLRVTDSPFLVQEGTPADGIVDEQADAFIKRFYEQLRLQQSIAATPTPDHSIRRGRRGFIR